MNGVCVKDVLSKTYGLILLRRSLLRRVFAVSLFNKLSTLLRGVAFATLVWRCWVLKCID